MDGSMSMGACRICGNESGNRVHKVREMMYGLREAFDYVECAACGCLQIRDIPDDLAKYYPSQYWDFQQNRMGGSRPARGVRAWWRKRRTRYWLSASSDPVGRLLALTQHIPRHITWLRRGGVASLDAAILDVGCGLGDRLLMLRRDGFSNLTGIDPYIARNISYPGGVKVLKKELHDTSGEFDFITLHHSFEHMADPTGVMRKLNELLKPGCSLLIRIPVADSFAWRTFGVDWAQLDAPRHFYLHTSKSMRHLACQTGFTIEAIAHDSDDFQFWGSEQYRQDIPLYNARSYEMRPEDSIFTTGQILEFRRHADRLNRTGEGDQACFYLKKTAQA